MRSAGVIVVLLAGTLSASAQETVLPQKPKPPVAAPKPVATPLPTPKPAPATAAAPPKPAPAKPPAATGSVPAAAAPPASRSAKDTYNAMPLADRVSIQTDLIWAGHYNGLANGDFTDLAINAI